MSSQAAFSKLKRKSKSKSKGKNKIRRIKTIRRRKISPRKRPGSPLSNEIKIEELNVDTSPKERITPVKEKSLKHLAIEMANKESQPSCIGKFCKNLSSKFTRRRGGKRKRRKTRKRRKGRRGSPPRRR
jgi:hypothetical protein